MKRNFYEAFTLVEMLIVMGILIILMAIGITAGRFAINRANDVAHQNAVDQIYQGLQAYYTDNRKFPDQETPDTLVGTTLADYLDAGAFKGGTDTTFFYIVEGTIQQSVLVCASLRGLASDNDTRDDGAYYCNGNGFGDGDLAVNITNKNFKSGELDFTTFTGTDLSTYGADWEANAW